MARLLVLFIFISIYRLNYVLSTKCCQMTDLYLESAKLETGGKPKHDPCIKFKDYGDCLDKKNVGICEWFCYLKKAEKQPPNAVKPKEPTTKKDKARYVFGKEELDALKAINSPSEYYSAYQLLTYDDKGKVDLYDFDPKFIEHTKSKERQEAKEEISAITKVPKIAGKPDLKKLHETCTKQALKHLGTYSDECEEYMVRGPITRSHAIATRRLIDNELNYNNSRRRLSIGEESEVGPGEVKYVPYSTVGVLFWDSNDGTEDITARGVGTVIKSVKEEDEIWYEYILTAGHNCWWHDAADGYKASWNIKFWKGLNQDALDLPAPTHPADMMKRVWVPIFTHRREDANDYCIIKYQVTAKGDTAIITGSAVRRDRMQLITYRFEDSGGIDIHHHEYRQRKVVNIHPSRLPRSRELYFVYPQTNRVGMSGSGLFLELPPGGIVTNIVCAVFVAAEGEKWKGTTISSRDVYTRLTREKINIIDNIITNKWDLIYADISEVLSARESYQNIMKNHFAHQYIQNNYDDMRKEKELNEANYAYPVHFVYPVYTENTSQYALYIVLFGSVCILGLICWFIILCCVAIVAFTSKLWISKMMQK